MTDVSSRLSSLLAIFREQFGAKPMAVVRAPGRVNLLGEHTDYNEGFVLPLAIDRSVLVAARPRPDRLVNVYSANFHRMISFSLDQAKMLVGDKFRTFIQGVGRCLDAQGYALRGMDAVVVGNVPIGSGLSSSAALEMAAILGFEYVSGISVPLTEKARIGQRVENEFVGVQSGIMDQFVAVHARKDHAILIDCRALSYELIPLDAAEVRIVVCDSGVRRSLAKSEYNRRRDECQKGVEIISKLKPGIRSLRDVSPHDLDSTSAMLPEVVRQRCLHVIDENERVLRGVAALKLRDLSGFGKLMCESHESLRDLYGVSCTELDLLVEAAMLVPGVNGSKMTGAGFGGCTVSLVELGALEEFARRVSEEYNERTGREVRIWACAPDDGAGIVLELGRN